MSDTHRKDPYEELYLLPHPESRSHPRMDALTRAAQFSPFAALTGYEQKITESAQLSQEEKEGEIRYVPVSEEEDGPA